SIDSVQQPLHLLAILRPVERRIEQFQLRDGKTPEPAEQQSPFDDTNSVALEHTRVSGKARDIGFNLHYLTQYVKSLETDTISMKLFSKAICEVALFDAFRYQHLLMPLRV